MHKKSFTLLEILVVLVIIGIIATVGIPMYQNAVENARAQECETHLKALKAGLDIYLMENDTMPATLSRIPSPILEKAYAAALKDAPLSVKFRAWLSQAGQRGYAYAESFLIELARGDMGLLSCPSARRKTYPGGPPTTFTPAYGLNSSLRGISARAYHALAASTPLIGDCDNPIFSGAESLAHRHKGFGFFGYQGYALFITKDSTVVRSGLQRRTQSYNP